MAYKTICALLLFWIVAIKTSSAGFCRNPFECQSTCYRTLTYKSQCAFGRECYKSRREPYLCRDTCYKLDCCPGYVGMLCMTPLCFGSTSCPNGGKCVRPDVCRCAEGFDGLRCTDRASACGLPPSVPNGHFQLAASSVDESTVARLECATGYTANSRTRSGLELHCGEDSYWSAAVSDASCDIIDCGQPIVSINHGRYTVLNGTEFGRQAIIKCEKGFTLEGGNNFIQCLDTGSWSISTATCVRDCPYGMVKYDSSCYYFGREDLGYTDARKFCRSFNSTLVEVNSAFENAFLKNKMAEIAISNSTTPTEGYWNDLFETTENGKEVWRETNTPLDPLFSDWYEGEPNNLGGNQSCTVFFAGFKYQWADVQCDDPDKNDRRDDRPFRPLCEMKLQSIQKI